MTGGIFVLIRYQLERFCFSNPFSENSLADSFSEIPGCGTILPRQLKLPTIQQTHEGHRPIRQERICSGVPRHGSRQMLELYFFKFREQFLSHAPDEALMLFCESFVFQLTLLLHHPQAQRQKDATRNKDRDQE
jgi:hypothetical protein